MLKMVWDICIQAMEKVMELVFKVLVVALSQSYLFVQLKHVKNYWKI